MIYPEYLSRDIFLRHNLILFCGSMAVAVFNYLYHPILGRMLSVQEFGEVQTLISLILQFTIIGGVFRIIVINVVSNREQREAKELVAMLHAAAYYLILPVSLIIVILAPGLERFFRFQSSSPFIALAAVLLSGIPIIFGEAALQGQRRFKELSVSQIIAAVGKLLLAVVFIYAGWSSAGAISAIVVAQIFAISYLTTRTEAVSEIRRDRIRIGRMTRRYFRYAFLVLIVSLTISCLCSLDILVVKHYFSSDVAGLYGGISVIAKIVFFVTGSIVGVMLPSIKLKDPDGNNARVLKRSLLLVFLVGGATLLAFTIFPRFVIGIMLGERYLAYASLLPFLGLTLFLICILNLLYSYLLAIRDYRATPISLIGLSGLLILSLLHHDSPYAIIQNTFVISLALITTVASILNRNNPDRP